MNYPKIISKIWYYNPSVQTEQAAMYARFLVIIDPLLKGRSHWRYTYVRLAALAGKRRAGER